MPKNAIAWVGVVLALLGVLWTAAEQWGELKARVTHLENNQRYLHGDVQAPGAP